MMLWDYTDVQKPIIDRKYDEILVIAWSFGIPIVEKSIPELRKDFNVTGVYAICGSRIPVDDEFGIPKAIFDSTLSSMSEKALQKFRIRITGGTSRYKELQERIDTDDNIEDLINQLAVFKDFDTSTESQVDWDYAFISEDDKIFPLANLIRVWRGTPTEILPNENHLPNFQSIFNRIIKDKNSISNNFQRSFGTYGSSAKVQNRLSYILVKNISQESKSFENVLEIGSGSGTLSQLLLNEINLKRLTLIDLCPISPIENVDYLCGDAECLIHQIEDNHFDLIVSGSTIQWFHSPRGFMKELYRIVRRGGICALSVFTKGTFSELEDMTGNSLLYLTPEQWKNMAENSGFQIEIFRTESDTMEFNSVKDIFEHIKNTGVNSLSGNKKTVREMRSIIDNYPTNENGKHELSYKSVILILRKSA